MNLLPQSRQRPTRIGITFDTASSISLSHPAKSWYLTIFNYSAFAMFLFQGTATLFKFHSWNNYMYSYFTDELYQTDFFSKSFYFYSNWSYLTGASVAHSWLAMIMNVCFSAHFVIESSPPNYGLNRRGYTELSLLSLNHCE